MKLRRLPGQFAVCKWDHEVETLPHWVHEGGFWQVLRTPTECTLICEERLVNKDVQAEIGWFILEVEGPLSFDLTGVLHKLLTPLAEHKIVILAQSGYSTDYIMVRDINAAESALREVGHIIV